MKAWTGDWEFCDICLESGPEDGQQTGVEYDNDNRCGFICSECIMKAYELVVIGTCKDLAGLREAGGDVDGALRKAARAAVDSGQLGQ
jgi:hypothetical protein